MKRGGILERGFVCLTSVQPRQRLRLEAAGEERMVTVRVVATRGRLHAVIFIDRQPPVVLRNTTGADMEVLPSVLSEYSLLKI